MPTDFDDAMRLVRVLIDEERARCLWYLRPDWYPAGADEAVRALSAIERHGDRSAFVRAAELRAWFSRHSSATSAV